MNQNSIKVAAPPIPRDAINRGILCEGIGCLWASLIGSGVGVTSYSGNIGALGVTKNGSPRTMIMASLLLLILGKFYDWNNDVIIRERG